MHSCTYRFDYYRGNYLDYFKNGLFLFLFLPLFGVSLRALRCSLNFSSSVVKYDSTTLLISSVDIVISEAKRLVHSQSAWRFYVCSAAWRGVGDNGSESGYTLQLKKQCSFSSPVRKCSHPPSYSWSHRPVLCLDTHTLNVPCKLSPANNQDNGEARSTLNASAEPISIHDFAIQKTTSLS